ncbi:MAG: HD domain-containing protein [Firmicutes bacterium]|nr:HD domain-containing protein [Bacillota bacterium]
MNKQMERINAILRHPAYQSWIVANNQAEQGRDFCRHGVEHAFDVARIAYALWLDCGGNPVAKDIVYAAALLHDVGRWQQYADADVDHAEASAELAEPLLLEVGYHPEVAVEICRAVRLHRKGADSGLPQILSQADKLSRPCFLCPSRAKCAWPEQKKNTELIY